MSYLKHKPGSIEEIMAKEASKLNDNAYQDMFKKELDKAGKGIGSMSPKEKKDFFNKIDDKYKAKNEEVSKEVKEEDAYDNDRFIIKNGKATVDNSNTADNKDHVHAPNAKIALQLHKQGKKVYKEELSAAQKKLPAGLQKAIKDKEQKEDLDNKDTSIVKAVVGQLKKAVKAHDGQAKDLEKAMKNEADQHGDEINDKKKEASKKGDKEPKKLQADSGSKLTKVETEPSVDYKN